MKIGFYGAGNMGSAVCAAVIDSGAEKAENIRVFDVNAKAAERLKEKYGITVSDDAKKVAESSDIIFVAVKPNIVAGLMTELKDLIKDKIIVSIAAGVTCDAFKGILGEDAKIVRTIPNMPAQVREGITGIYFCNISADDEIREYVVKLFEAFGKAIVVGKECMIEDMIAVTSSSPAYVCLMVEAMADVAVKYGFKRDDAYMMAEQAILGTTKLMLEEKINPSVLKDKICSPGGTTIEAVEALETEGFRRALMVAMEACTNKAHNMNK